MKFAKYTFLIAGIYGLLVIIPPFFLETKIGIDNPPPITHLEYFYGFNVAVLAWQVLFIIISTDPVRYRPAMLAAFIEKFGFVIAVPILNAQGRVGTTIVYFCFIDLILGVLFVLAYLKTPKRRLTYET